MFVEARGVLLFLAWAQPSHSVQNHVSVSFFFLGTVGFGVLRITQNGEMCTVVQANEDAKKTSGMFLRIAQN